MKKLALLATLMFSLMFSSASFAEWKKVSRNVAGDIYYVDFDSIRKHGGFVYFWKLTNYLKPSPYGDLSYKTYHEGDCKLYRQKVLTGVSHKQPMGRDTGDSYNPKNEEWGYPSPEATMGVILKAVCDHVR